MKNKAIVFLLAAVCLAGTVAAQQGRVKNVIFVVGDGTGVAQVYASVTQAGEKSAFLRFPVSGFSRTYCLDRYSTDSGAGGTALVCGHKVNYHAVGEAPDGTDYPSFLVLANQQLGKSSGFVVTSSVLDATPASTYAHVPDRKMKEDISLQMARCPHQVMIGGDYGHFLPSRRKDDKSPIDTLRARGYEVTFSLDSMLSSKSDRLCLLFGKDEYPPSAKKRNGLLCKGVVKAIEVLDKNPNGFTLLVEGSQIDWACHNNDKNYMMEELADFDKVLNTILDWAEKDGNTLVVVTADHETGGLTLPDGDLERGTVTARYTTLNHTGVMVPVFAYGPGSERFTGIMQNTDIFHKIMNLMQGK
ncbi:MAG: alkaline phosphatase [Bacteroidales bacterium]|nr:alkaline phosphatase [Bacteroidales bacterium]